MDVYGCLWVHLCSSIFYIVLWEPSKSGEFTALKVRESKYANRVYGLVLNWLKRLPIILAWIETGQIYTNRNLNPVGTEVFPGLAGPYSAETNNPALQSIT